MKKDTWVIKTDIVVQADNKHEAAKIAGKLLNGKTLDWGPRDFQDGKEMDYIGKVDPVKYKEGDYLKTERK